MKKVILVDGNNLMFRSYYATLYSGSMMTNSEGFPTNALYGFVNMMNKIISEENPEYIMVAFDIGKTFRHEKYDYYKGKRDETPEDLKKQFPVAKKILNAMGIKYFELAGYEADDIIGTFAKKVDEEAEFVATIVSSDKDLLQLISEDVDVKLLKQKDYIRMNREVFMNTYGLEPIKMIDLKSLMGDQSDNIPGVKGIGEKTAIKLLQTYSSLDGVYQNIENIKGATKQKLITDKDNAYMSYDIATIYREVPIDTNLDNIKYQNELTDELINIYNDLDFHSLLRKTTNKTTSDDKIKYNIIKDLNNIDINSDVAINIDLDNDNYHQANIIGVSIYNDNLAIYIKKEDLVNTDFLNKISIYTYNYKKLYSVLTRNNLYTPICTFDTLLAAYLLNYSVKDDIAYLAEKLDYPIKVSDKKEKLTEEEFIERSLKKAKFIYNTVSPLKDKLIENNQIDLLTNIEMPLSIVLAKMELTGIRIDKKQLEDMKEDIKIKIELISKDIYNYAGHEFNISSPKQLGEVLFDELKLPYAKKNKTGYVTDANVLGKLIEYPIIKQILEYRLLNKLYTTYIEGILNATQPDGKIHTIYTQALTRTGRLSSIEPNLQNIPIRNEFGRLIRKAFIPEENSQIMSSDYSQIELRIFAHLSNTKELIEAFNNKMDIHTKTAMDIFKVPDYAVTKNMRRQAKAVNFGILYGISPYGLAEDIGISPKEAKAFIDTYFKTYPGIKDYMNKEIEEAHKNGYVKTIMNRTRNIEELSSSNYMQRSMGERMALNTPIQGSSADILKKAMIEIDEKFKEENIKSTMLLQVHDELIFNVLNEEKEKVKNIVKETMEHTIKLNVPLEVDIEFGNNWYDAK
ncbi:MAG: DNA polymerase I [Erysipelotrichaceae bacterium]|nr:DNA polymerase I [Erysipelotrichaceae bacterium]